MSIMSPHLIFSPRALPLLVLSRQELRSEFCRVHPDEVVCFEAGSGGSGIAAVSCLSDSECAAATPVCDAVRSICVQCAADEPGACTGTTPTYGDDAICRSRAMDAGGDSMTFRRDGSCAAAGITSFDCTLTIMHSRIARDFGYGLLLVDGDIDGEARPQGPGREMGSDEIK